jgi:hypothetical protein
MNFNPKHQVKVNGKMSTKDAGIIGKDLAKSAKAIAYATAFTISAFGLNALLPNLLNALK